MALEQPPFSERTSARAITVFAHGRHELGVSARQIKPMLAVHATELAMLERKIERQVSPLESAGIVQLSNRHLFSLLEVSASRDKTVPRSSILVNLRIFRLMKPLPVEILRVSGSPFCRQCAPLTYSIEEDTIAQLQTTIFR